MNNYSLSSIKHNVMASIKVDTTHAPTHIYMHPQTQYTKTLHANK